MEIYFGVGPDLASFGQSTTRQKIGDWTDGGQENKYNFNNNLISQKCMQLPFLRLA